MSLSYAEAFCVEGRLRREKRESALGTNGRKNVEERLPPFRFSHHPSRAFCIFLGGGCFFFLFFYAAIFIGIPSGSLCEGEGTYAKRERKWGKASCVSKQLCGNARNPRFDHLASVYVSVLVTLHIGDFFPHRFSEAEKAKRHPYSFMPFGFGPHNCVGMRFALLEIKLTLVKLLKKYKIERTEKTAVSVASFET